MTTEINNIDSSKLRNREYYQFCSQSLDVVKSYGPAALKVQPQYDALNLKLVQINGVLVIQQKSFNTEKLELIDQRRDRAIGGISMFIESMLNHFEPEKVMAAKLLKLSTDAHGPNIGRQTFNAETATIDSIVKDWKNKAELQDAVKILGLETWMEELAKANKEFNDTFLERNKEVLNNPDEKLKELRLEANTLYYNLKRKLSSHADIADFAPPYNNVIREWNNLVDTYNQLLDIRAGKNNADNSEPTDAPQPTDTEPTVA